MCANFVKGSKLAQKLMAKLVEQLACMKVWSSFYFQPLSVSRPPPKFRCIKSLNVEACPICNENFDFNDIRVAFCSHTSTLGVYWSTLLLQESVKPPNVRRSFMNRCSSFGLSTTMAEVIKVEDPRDDGSPQLTPTTSSQNIWTCMQSLSLSLNFS